MVLHFFFSIDLNPKHSLIISIFYIIWHRIRDFTKCVYLVLVSIQDASLYIYIYIRLSRYTITGCNIFKPTKPYYCCMTNKVSITEDIGLDKFHVFLPIAIIDSSTYNAHNSLISITFFIKYSTFGANLDPLLVYCPTNSFPSVLYVPLLPKE